MELVAAFFVVVLVAVLLHQLWRDLAGLPPGPWGIPILGRIPFLRLDMARLFAELTAVYGPILSFRLGTKIVVVIGSASTAAEILNDTVFANHLRTDVAETLFAGADVTFAPHGPLWRNLRQVSVRELLSPKAINTFRELRRREMLRMLEELRASTGCAVDVRGAVYSHAANVMMGMVWDEALEDGKTHVLAAELRRVIDSLVEILAAPNVSDFLPWLAPLDLLGLRRKARRISAWFDTTFQSVLDHKRSRGRRDDDDDGDKAKDFLQLMLNLTGKGEVLRTENIRYLVFDMITGGTDTTSTTVEWAISELVRRPTTMARLQDELDAVVGSDAILDESRLVELPYLDAVVKETLRLNPVFPLVLPRTPSSTSKVGGYRIPRGAIVFVNAWAIQRDPSVWEEPLEFRPERFLDEGKGRWGYSGKASAGYMPFGGGRRACPGFLLAERMVKFTLASLVHSFDWRLPPGAATVDMEGDLGVVNKRKQPLVLVPYVRNRSLHL